MSLSEFVVAAGGARFTGTLAAPVTVTVPYPDARDTGFVDGTSPPLRAASLQLYVLNEGTGQWGAVPGSTVDATRKVVTGQIGHLSIFTALGAAVAPDLSTVRVYPNPYKPNSGDPDRGAGSAGIFFDNLPLSATIKIYTVRGQSVASFSSDNTSGELSWDARNGAGRDVATGLYVAVISSPGQASITKKILVIR